MNLLQSLLSTPWETTFLFLVIALPICLFCQWRGYFTAIGKSFHLYIPSRDDKKPGLPSSRAYRWRLDALALIPAGLLIFAGGIQLILMIGIRGNTLAHDDLTAGTACIFLGVGICLSWHFLAAGLRAFCLPGHPILYLLNVFAQIAIPVVLPCYMLLILYREFVRRYQYWQPQSDWETFVSFLSQGENAVFFALYFSFAFSILAGLRFPKFRRLTYLWKPRRLPRLPHPQKGFTLIELLITIAIIAIFAAGALNASSSLSQAMDRQQTRQEALALAEDQIALLRANGAPAPGEYPVAEELARKTSVAQNAKVLIKPSTEAGFVEARVRVLLYANRPQSNVVELAVLLPTPPASPVEKEARP